MAQILGSVSEQAPPQMDVAALMASPDFANLKGETDASLPVIDLSALMSEEAEQENRQLLKACEEWGFFFLVNHGIAEGKMEEMLRAAKEFFDLPEEEKRRNLAAAHAMQSAMKYGRDDIVYTSNRELFLWRDSLKLHLHPNQFHLPDKPQLLREAIREYSEIMRKMAKTLVEAVSDAMDVDRQYANQVLELDSAFQILIANLYPPCPHHHQTMGLPAHTDLGLFAFVIQNGVAGLQLQKDGAWYNVDYPHDGSILVNVADHLEIFSNGRCRSVKHRASTNGEKERISVVVTSGPSMEALVGPAEALVERDGRALYAPRTYADYMAKKYVSNPNHCE